MGIFNEAYGAKDGPSTIKSVETAFNIVECIYQRDSVGVSELAELMDMPKSTAHIYLKTLERAGYVNKLDGRYTLSYRFLRIGGGKRSKEKIYRIGLPAIESLAATTGELVDLLVEEHGLGVLLDKSFGENAIDDQVHIGKYVHLHSTASGKAILAHLPENRIDEVIDTYNLPQLTPNTITDRAEMHSKLAEIKERGVAFNMEEQTMGLRAIGAPILTNTGDVVGALSICGTTARMSEDRMKNELTEHLIEASNIIELQSEPAPL